MSTFDLAKLRRLSEAATPVAKWDAGVWCNYDDGGWAARGPHHQSDDGNDEPETDTDLAARRDRDLIAYLGTHREAIIARLEAADALASVVQEHCDDAVPQWAPTLRRMLAAYEKAKGA